MGRPVAIRSELPGLTVHDCRETVFFVRDRGRLCQAVDLDVTCGFHPPHVTAEIRSGGQAVRRLVFAEGGKGKVTLRLLAPLRWPRGADPSALLTLRHDRGAYQARITIGSHRPWTIYLLSDHCADDTWAYSDLAAHDRDDYRTLLSELSAGPANRYNLAAVYQVERFFRQASASQRRALALAIRTGRIFVTPIPNQLLCGAFVLGAYPLLLEPYRYWMGRCGVAMEKAPRDAYHMELTTWTNGLANLLACAGFRSFGKSLLRYQAPWVELLEPLPRLMRLQTAPGRFVYLLLRCGDYYEGASVLAGPPHANRYLHEDVIPRHEGWGKEYPVTAIPLVGAYGDLCRKTPDLAALKQQAVEQYNGQGWEYPRLLNATWVEFFDHVVAELGPPQRPLAGAALRQVRGETSSSWETRLLAAQAVATGFRKAQRDVVSLRTLLAMRGRASPAMARAIQTATMQTVALGDHAWNGSSLGSKRLNLALRKRRLKAATAAIAAVRRRLSGGVSWRPGGGLAVVNTLGWRRTCRVDVPLQPARKRLCLVDRKTRQSVPIVWRRGPGGPARAWADVPDVPPFSARRFQVRASPPGTPRPPRAAGDLPIPLTSMQPTLELAGRAIRVRGRWREGGQGRWQAGPFGVRAAVLPLADGGVELQVRVTGRPPAGPYELRWQFRLPWKRCAWRGQSGGGFVTPGPPEEGGDFLLGIAGSVFAVGEGLSAIAPAGGDRVDFAFDESGLCGPGGPRTALSRGDYHQRLPAKIQRQSAMASTRTAGRLEWYLLATAQNHRALLIDQGGARSWRFRCAIRRRRDELDDAGLYRFAAGFTCRGEIVSATDPAAMRESWLHLAGSREVVALGASREGRKGIVDLYNTSARPRSVLLAGRGARGRRIIRADMLGRPRAACPGGRVRLEPQAYVRIILI